MPTASINKEIPCSKDNLIKMVLDIERYPEFVPWCIKGKIQSVDKKEDKIEIIGELTIGKSFFNETYKSYIVYEKSKDKIFVTNMDGPLKHLKNTWFFQQKGKNSEVSFHIDFELKNKILNSLMHKSFDLGLRKIANAFESRAIKLFNNI